jgi:hypothetical protein
VINCLESIYSGTTISLKLDHLAASSITIKYKIYMIDTSNTQYFVRLNDQSPI